MEFLEVPLYDDDLIKMLVRLAFNVTSMFFLVRICYSRHQKDKNSVFMFLLMNLVIFFICFTLKKLDLGLGMALGLFAIFGIIRFRTDAMRVKEMTYLFLVIGLAVINALSNKNTSYAELVVTNFGIIGATLMLERMFYHQGTKLESVLSDDGRIDTKAKGKTLTRKGKALSREFVYDRMDLLRPGQSEDLLSDLKQQTGLEIERVNILSVDFGTQTALVCVRYRPFHSRHDESPHRSRSEQSIG